MINGLVVVVGAGVCGLSVAHGLGQAGYRVCVLEQAFTATTAGRIRTVRVPSVNLPGEWVYGEGGAMRVMAGHMRCLRLLQILGVPYRPYVEGSESAFYLLRGKRGRMRALCLQTFVELDIINAADAMESDFDSGLNASVDGMLLHVFSDRLADLESKGFAFCAEQYDCSILAYVEQYGRTGAMAACRARVVTALLHVMFGKHPEGPATCVALVEFLCFLQLKMSSCFEVTHGFDVLQQALVDRVHDCVHFGQRVTGLTDDGNQVTVRYLDLATGRSREMHAALVVLTASCPSMFDPASPNLITFEPPLPLKRAQCLSELQYIKAIKLFLHFRERFWETDGIAGGTSLTDTALGTIHYPSSAHATGGATDGLLLAVYRMGDLQPWCNITPDERAALALDCVAQCHGQEVRELYLGAVESLWYDAGNPAYCLLAPGQYAGMQASLNQPFGRIYFAGEHVSSFHAWIEGALQSAEQTVQQLLARLAPVFAANVNLC